MVAQAPSLLMNSLIPNHAVEQAYQDDAASAKAGYGAEFRTDVKTFVNREIVDPLVCLGRYELPYLSENKYFAFVDRSGGSKDAFTLSIAHKEKNVLIGDTIRPITPPFNPEKL